MKTIKWISISFLLFVSLSAQTQKGKLAGQVVDSRSLQPLVGVNVIVVSSGTLDGSTANLGGAATDAEGFFVVNNLQPAGYNLEIVYLGYRTLLKNNVVINNCLKK